MGFGSKKSDPPPKEPLPEVTDGRYQDNRQAADTSDDRNTQASTREVSPKQKRQTARVERAKSPALLG